MKRLAANDLLKICNGMQACRACPPVARNVPVADLAPGRRADDHLVLLRVQAEDHAARRHGEARGLHLVRASVGSISTI